MFFVAYDNTRSTQKSPVRHKNSGSTQKWHTQHASVDIAIIKRPPLFIEIIF